MAYDSARGVTVLFGGDDEYRQDDTWEWDGTDWTVRATTNKPAIRYLHAMAYDSSRGVTVLFGGNGNFNVLLNDTWEYGIMSKPAIKIFLPLVLRLRE